MKKVAIFMITLMMIIGCVACSNSGNAASSDGELKEVEITLDNFYEYFDFVEISDGKWIAVNKKYEEGMVIWTDDSLDIATGAKFDEDGDHKMASSIFTFIFSEKPEITDVRGCIMFAVNGTKYVDEQGRIVVECGSHSRTSESSGIDRVDYFDEYPY